MRMLCQVTLLCAVTALLGAGSAIGQTTSGTIRGRVRDPQGAPVPAVTVSVTGHGNGVTRTVKTDADGMFVVSNLPPGTVDLDSLRGGISRRLPHEHRARGRPNRFRGPGSLDRQGA